MDAQRYYTVEVYETSKSDDKENPQALTKFIQKYHNMISAKIMDGKILELEHSRLAGYDVKFKTVVDYRETVGDTNSLGIHLSLQDGYIVKDT